MTANDQARRSRVRASFIRTIVACCAVAAAFLANWHPVATFAAGITIGGAIFMWAQILLPSLLWPGEQIHPAAAASTLRETTDDQT